MDRRPDIVLDIETPAMEMARLQVVTDPESAIVTCNPPLVLERRW